jgi:hypothetical protein
LVDNDLLQYDSATSKWINTTNPAPPASGIFGYWDRTGTTLSPGTSGDSISTTGDLNIGIGGTTLDVDSTFGTVGIGQAATSQSLITASGTTTPTDNFSVISGSAGLTVNTATKSYAALDYTMLPQVNESTVAIRGVKTTVDISGISASNVTIDDVCGFCADMSLFRGGKVTLGDVTATVFSMFKGEAIGALGANGFITSLYGLFLPDITEGTNSWAIKTGLGKVETGGGRVVRTTRLTTTTTLDENHHRVFCDTDGGAFTVTLPATPNNGQEYRIINTGSSGNDLTIGRNGNTLTGGTVDRTLSDGSVIILTYETTEGWW